MKEVIAGLSQEMPFRSNKINLQLCRQSHDQSRWGIPITWY